MLFKREGDTPKHIIPTKFSWKRPLLNKHLNKPKEGRCSRVYLFWSRLSLGLWETAMFSGILTWNVLLIPTHRMTIVPTSEISGVKGKTQWARALAMCTSQRTWFIRSRLANIWVWSLACNFSIVGGRHQKNTGRSCHKGLRQKVVEQVWWVIFLLLLFFKKIIYFYFMYTHILPVCVLVSDSL